MLKNLLLFTISAALLSLVSCENDPKEIEALTKKVPEVETGKDIIVNFTQTGNRKAYLTAPLMLRTRDDSMYTEFPKTLHVDFFDEHGQLQNVVKAQYAKYLENRDKVFLRDSVVVYNMKGDTLYCKTLWWDKGAESFYTDDSVYIKRPGSDLKGTGLHAKSDFSAYTVLNPSGVMPLPDQSAPGGGSGPAGASPF